MDNPINKFETWWQEALLDSPLQQKNAVCVSTINENGFPTGRFVDLKSVSEDGFVFCTCFDSAKGKQIARDSKASMTIWWDHLGYQIRVIGSAQEIAVAEADRFWQSRSRTAQLTTTAFEQSEPLNSELELAARLQDVSAKLVDQVVPMPANWGGTALSPFQLSFLHSGKAGYIYESCLSAKAMAGLNNYFSRKDSSGAGTMYKKFPEGDSE